MLLSLDVVEPLVSCIIESGIRNDITLNIGLLSALSEQHAHVVVSSLLCRLKPDDPIDHQRWVVLLSLLGKLCSSSDSFLSALICNKDHHLTLLSIVSVALSSDAMRSSSYFLLVKMMASKSISSIRFALMPHVWDAVCVDVCHGHDGHAGNLRSNALALLCYLLQAAGEMEASVPWPKVVDALVTLVSSGVSQHCALACHLLLEAYHKGQGEMLLQKDVAEYCFSACTVMNPNDAALKKVLQLILALALTGPSFGPHVQFGKVVLLSVIDTQASSGTGEMLTLSMELLGVIMGFEECQDEKSMAIALDVLFKTSVSVISSDLRSSLILSWLQVCTRVVSSPIALGEDVASALAETCKALFRMMCSATDLLPQVLALSLSLCSYFHESAYFESICKVHQNIVLQWPHVSHEMVTQLVHVDAPQAMSLFPLAMQALFNARSKLSETDNIIGDICDSLLTVARKISPWWTPRVSKFRLCIARLPEGMRDPFVGDEHALSIYMGFLATCLKVGWNPGNVITLEDVIQFKVPNVESVVVMCQLGFAECKGPLANEMTSRLLNEGTRDLTLYPDCVVRWVMNVPRLEPLVVQLLQNATEETIHRYGALLVGSVISHQMLHVALWMLSSGDVSMPSVFLLKGFLPALMQFKLVGDEAIECAIQIVSILAKEGREHMQACLDVLLGHIFKSNIQSVKTWLLFFNVTNSLLHQQHHPLQKYDVQVPDHVGVILGYLQMMCFCRCPVAFDWVKLLERSNEWTSTLVLSFMRIVPLPETLTEEALVKMWYVLLAQTFSPFERVREAVGYTCEAMLNKVGTEKAKLLLQKPWSLLALRCVVDSFISDADGLDLTYANMFIMHAGLEAAKPYLDSRMLLEKAVSLFCLNSNENNAVLEFLVLAHRLVCMHFDLKNQVAASAKQRMNQVDAAVASTSMMNVEGAHVFLSLLETKVKDKRWRDDKLIRLR